MEKEKAHVIDMDFVRFIMEKKGIGIKAMSASIGISPISLKRYLDGADQGQLLADMPYKFAKAIGVPLVRLIHRDYFYVHKSESN